MALLDEQTAIATRTRMNADYVPGMVTVLHGDELEARGARTVWEALALVPGMETAIEKTGRRKVLVRGLGNTWASGNVKVLLNDVSMNSAELGLADPVFNIPVEQVDRIEVIRGPGSAVYGEYAYMGVINVITRADQNRLFTFGGSYNTAGAGATLDLSAKDEPVQASINVAGWRTSGADVRTGRDLVYAFTFPEGAAAVSNAPGRANEDVDAATAVLKLGYQHFSLTAQWAQDGLGDFFGASYFLPPESDRIVERTRHRTVDMRQEIPFGSALVGGIQLSWKDVARARDHQLDYPASSLAEGNYIDSRYLESTTGVTADLSYRGWDKHALLAAVTTSLVRVDKDRSHNSSPVAAPSISVSGMSRQVTAVTVQDEYRHSDLFTLTTGIRYDEYSDVGVRYSPRIAGVWRVDDRNIVKAQYAEAFRPPTLFEIASAAYNAQPQPPAARIRTFEAGYIFREPTAETRVTTFYSTLDDLVVFAHDLSAASGFATQSATSSGVELEQEWRFSSALTFEGNLSRVDTNDEETGAPFPGSAKWLANAGISYRAASFLGAVQAHYVSNYYRQPGDPRPELPGYTTIDVTGSFTRIMGGNAQLRVGIKNLFDAGVRYPAPLVAVRPTPTSTSDVFVPSYAGDYPQAGRTWWLELGYAF